MTERNYSYYLQKVIEDAWTLQFVPEHLKRGLYENN